MSIYKLRAAGAGGTQDAIASLDIQFDGTIEAIWGSLFGNIDADADFVQMELSFLSGNTIAVNDARGSLFIMALVAEFVTAASGIPGHTNGGIGGLSIPVSAGERAFMHLVATAGVGSVAQGYLYVRDAGSVALRRRR